jgi:hypothetical protein
MKFRSFVAVFALMGFTCGVLLVRAQDEDEGVRGAFLSSRPKTTSTTSTTATHRHRPPRRTSGSSASAANANNGKTQGVVVNQGNKNTGSVNVPLQAIGLGYTLFMRSPSGRSVRVEPDREFHNGDGVRIALEPNVDGYLYVFHTEGDGAPEMIYPDPRLDGGENWIEAHVPMEVPSSEESDERLRWFTFYGNAGVERLYVVMTREPLSSVPTGEDLVSFCAANKDKCPWHPSPDAWKQVQQATRADVKMVASKSFGQTQTEKEKVATTRGLGLDQSAPEPSVIRMNASTNAPLLVTILDLIHK